jgi:DNA primase
VDSGAAYQVFNECIGEEGQLMNIRAELERRVDQVTSTHNGVMIRCPFHDDENPSMGVDTKRGIFHCFSCGESGTIYKLLAQLDGVPIDEIRERYQEEWQAQRVLEGLEEELFGDNAPPVSRAYKMGSFNRAFPFLEVSDAGMMYVQMRGLDDRTISNFDLRWGSRGKYKDRVIIPVFDIDGRLISYSGRAIHKGVVPKIRKPVGNKALSTLFGLYRVLESKELILVEGEIDAMYLQQWGFPAVATMGTSHLTDSQVNLILKYASEVTLMFDGDDAGRKATQESSAALKPFMPVHVVTLPEGKDPADLGASELLSLLEKASEKEGV